MRNQFLIALAAGLLGAISMFGFVQATPGNGVTSTLFAVGRFDDIDAKTLTDIDPTDKTDLWQARINTKGSSDLYILENRIAPGGTFGWHSHPGPSLVVVKIRCVDPVPRRRPVVHGPCRRGRSWLRRQRWRYPRRPQRGHRPRRGLRELAHPGWLRPPHRRAEAGQLHDPVARRTLGRLGSRRAASDVPVGPSWCPQTGHGLGLKVR